MLEENRDRGRGRGAHLDRVLISKEVDNLECVRNDPDSHDLLAVVPSLHHKAASRVMTDPSTEEPSKATYLSTRRSTMGIWAFLNCFLA